MWLGGHCHNGQPFWLLRGVRQALDPCGGCHVRATSTASGVWSEEMQLRCEAAGAQERALGCCLRHFAL